MGKENAQPGISKRALNSDAVPDNTEQQPNATHPPSPDVEYTTNRSYLMICARSTSTPRLRIACLGRSRSLPPCSPATVRCPGRRNVTTALVHRGPGPPESLRRIPHLQVRGKKTRTVFKLDDLPQGFVAPLEPLPPEEDEPAYPTVMLQARRNMQKFDSCVLLTRVGGFYELYFDHADEYGPLLNLKVAQKKTSAGPVPMAGFPFFQLDRFLKILVQDCNRHVAIAEEFPNDPSDKVKSGGLMHTRKVTRIVTPGTLIDENFMDPYANNYVMAIHLPEKAVSDDTMRDGALKGSLLHAIRRTVTTGGARLLNEWLTAPPHPDNDSEAKSLSAMVDRISLEQPLKLAEHIRDAIDEEGLVQQHQIKDSETDEIIALAQEIVKTEGTEEDSALLPKSAVAKSAAAAAKKKATSLRDHYGEDSEVWIMKPGASPLLKRLHRKLAALREEKDTLTETLRARLGASSLTLRWTPGLGHICHVRGRDARSPPTAGTDDDADAQIRTLSSSRSTRTFHQPEWTGLGEGLDRVRQQIRGEEQRVFGALRGRVVANLVKLRRNALVLDELDIATSFALLAVEQGLARPALSNAQQTIIVGGRHPTVEGGLAEQGRTFQKNDLFLGSAPGARAVAAATHDGGGQQQQQQQQSHGRIWLITGPNMAGKSTFLRQNALITILAQIGCYVPADYASLGIVDAIFSRVGSADNLFQDQSTFMVEMLETAAILQQATPRSFVIMDEVGRGTTPEDGTAVAFAALHHLVTVNKCRALFATHFHGIADLVAKSGFRLEDGGPNGTIDAYCTDVEEDEQGRFVYVHKLRKGVNRQSHALKVARLAGLPEQAIQVAQQVLQHSGVEMSPGIVQPSKIAAAVG
ncbi:hypothetical protein CHGG_00977 [Chaetomium globosum CBS 148.51]|uniref:DNA mismatch repair proteins mutS family domain-containing protein n=1 Tax=Chaetomium globosum (strain ATCC 6205 / CBS 148.51 / DSM 1962 / NBRC 6347 / NRRL 1970) TaxID=306901 RepID=Q2HFM7_CHAGB|nr:uncharacterized protein CHGG_00977 [Chaetomium globosum CBS 148.51]EAQ92742.1 hypothetical protein CHGG_00977 [Chaetomium globosum CBS 148.51]